MYNMRNRKLSRFFVRSLQRPGFRHCVRRSMQNVLQKPENTRPIVRFKRSAFVDTMRSICSYAPETGGILLGPIETDHVITDFYFDKGAICSGSTYSPDHVALSKKMQKEWIPAGMDMKGFVHSHPNSFDRLSSGDLVYISRLLKRNTDMSMFIAPIIIPHQFRMNPYVVLRDNLNQAQQPRIIFF